MGSTLSPVEETTEQDERQRRDGESGQGMVEYVFIVVLIAIAVIIALQVLGHTTNNLFSNISNGLTGTG
jgi:Flp pilus assembly pilin Flp